MNQSETVSTPTLPRERGSTWTRPSRVHVMLALGVVALMVLGGLLGVAYGQSISAGTQYQQARAQLVSDIKTAEANGLTPGDLASISAQLNSISDNPAAILPNSRTDFYNANMRTLDQLHTQLQAQQQQVLQTATSDTATQLASVQAGIAHDQQVEVADSQLATFTKLLADLTAAKTAATTVKDARSVDSLSIALHNDVIAAGVHQDQENAAIQAAATALVQQTAGNLGAIQQAGNAALAASRNDASVASYEAKPGRFPNLAPLMDVYNQTEHYTVRLASPDVNQAAFGTAAIQRYSAVVHQKMVDGLGAKHIIVSFQDQHVYAYENGKVVMDSKVTTGIRGVTAYGTDFGPMKVLSRSHPWKFQSPWPRGSQYWYPDTVVQWTTFFTNSGESFHDASWEPDSALGPGSQFNAWSRSHGCIHLPFTLAEWMYNWTTVGVPVDVYPGDGKPVAEQLSQMTTDAQGNPLNPA